MASGTAVILALAFAAQSPPSAMEAKRLALFDLPALAKKLHLPVDAIIADVGAGEGLLALEFAKLAPKGKVIATELRPELLATLNARAKKENLTHIETRVVTEDEPGLAAKSVDLIVLSQVDHYFKDRAHYLKLLRAALKDRGRVVIINYEKYRAGAIGDADAAGFRVLEAWTPARPYYTAILEAR